MVSAASLAVAIQACQRCAHTKFRIPSLGDGIIPETDNLGEWTCVRCGLRAVPLEFDRREDYDAFRDGLTDEDPKSG